MATITITNTNVVPANSAGVSTGTSGETFTAGTFVYLKQSDNRWYKADCTTLEKSGSRSSNRIRLALNDSLAAGQPVTLLEPGNQVTIGSAIVTRGVFFYLSPTSGKMCTVFADLSSGHESLIVAYAVSTDAIVFNPIFSGVVV